MRNYGGGGYVLRLKGYIDDLKANIETLKEEKWVNNRTRALIVQFSVYNVQVHYHLLHRGFSSNLPLNRSLVCQCNKPNVLSLTFVLGEPLRHCDLHC